MEQEPQQLILQPKLSKEVQLRTAQKIFLQKAEESRKEGKNKGIIIFPTGLGKSIAVFSFMKQFKGKLLILAHREDLLRQLAKDFANIIKDKKIGFMYKLAKDYNADIIFGNVKTIQKYLHKFKKDEFSCIAIDETHRARAKTYMDIINYFTPEFMIGMTATPNRTDRQDVLSLYDNNTIYEVSEEEAFDKRWLRPYSIIALWDKWCDYNDINGYYNKKGFFKYNIKEVGKKYLVPERIKGIINILKNGLNTNDFKFEGIKNLKGIYFLPRVNAVKKYCEEFNKNGIKSAYIIGNTLPKKREEILKDFKEGKIQLIFNVDIIGEGMHIKGTDLVVIDRPTESYNLWTQSKGRQIFNIEGQTYKREGLVIDIVGNSRNEFKKYCYNQSKVSKNKPKEDIRQLIEKSIGVKCIFQPEVINDFNTNLKLTKQELIDYYFELKKKLGRHPKSEDFQNKNNPKYSISLYCKEFGKWNQFLKSVNETLINKGYHKLDNINCHYCNKLFNWL